LFITQERRRRRRRRLQKNYKSYLSNM